jgi:hypothetical protein
MSILLDKVVLLRALAEDVDDDFCRRVQQVFRERFEQIFEDDKLAYVQAVIDGQYLTYEKLAEMMGFSGASAISNLRKTGSIRLDKFELLRSTIGESVAWPSPESRKARALVAVVNHVQQKELQRPADPPFDLEDYYSLKLTLGGDKRLDELIEEQEEDAWVSAVLQQVRSFVPTSKLRARDLRGLIDRWSPAFVRTQLGLLSFVR